MTIKRVEEFKFPINLNSILKEDEYWEDESFEPISITVEEIEYYGESIVSYQASFEVLDEHENIDGDRWEELIRIYISEKEPELLKLIKGDSESSTCVIWTNSKSNFKRMLRRMIELIEEKTK